MQGVVTLAAMFLLPDATLGPLLHWLGITNDGSVEREVAAVRHTPAGKSLAAIDGRADNTAMSARIQLRQIAEREEATTHQGGTIALERFELDILSDQRETLDATRRCGEITGEAF